MKEELENLGKRCVELCETLRDCLERERQALVSLNMEELNASNLDKESLVCELIPLRQHFRELRSKESGDSGSYCEADLSRWNEVWLKTRRLCETNRELLSHSIRNMGLMGEHLKGLFKDRGTYSSRGLPRDNASSGKVVEVVT